MNRIETAIRGKQRNEPAPSMQAHFELRDLFEFRMLLLVFLHRNRRQRASSVLQLEAVRESQIGVGERRSVVLAGHQFTGEEVPHSNIGDEGLVVDVLG